MPQPQLTVLVVDDEPELRKLVAESMEARGYAVAEAADAADALSRLEGFAYDGLVLDVRLPDGDGLDVLDAAVARYPQIRTVVITGAGGVTEAVAAMKRGAVDFLAKPFSLKDLAIKLDDALRHAPAAQPTLVPSPTVANAAFTKVVGQSAAIRHVVTTLERIAPMNSTVLIHGETGTGKELIARTIHEHSTRRDMPFVAVNAAAIPEGLIEAELFGHIKGAFTGAVASRTGRFESAHRGTLFIDEVSSMSLPLQAKLLRAVQEREIERVGESRSFKFDVRLIAATNMDLRKMVREGTFREDLFYRLNVIPLTVPPLRARREDIALLAHFFVQQSCRVNGVGARTLSQAALRLLMNHEWPGNIRQLENAMEHAVAMSGNDAEIGPAMLPEEIRDPGRDARVPSVLIPDEGINFVSVVSQLERDLILRCLEKTGGNKRQAARLLNLSRTTLIDKLQRLDQAGTATVAVA